jgi:hypothetical protein
MWRHKTEHTKLNQGERPIRVYLKYCARAPNAKSYRNRLLYEYANVCRKDQSAHHEDKLPTHTFFDTPGLVPSRFVYTLFTTTA